MQAWYTLALMDNLTYEYTPGTNKVLSISDGAMSAQGGFRAGLGQYTYDANGNMLTNGAKGITSISYNHLNLPTNITITGGKTIDFTYAADGTRLRKVVKTGATINLVMEYVNGIEYRGTAIPATTLEAVYFSEGRMYNSSGTWKREYVIKDHLGNTRIAYCDINGDGVIAVPGEILQENNYDAFGYGLDGVYMNHANADNLYQYNGKELNGDHGLNWLDYGARWYDGSIGRWTIVDALTDHPNQSNMSPYAYAWNNPVNLNDPDGNCPTCPLAVAGGLIGGLIGGGIEAGRQLIKNGSISDWKAVGGATAQGAITGAVAGLTGGGSLLASAGASAAGNVIGGATNRAIQGQSTSTGDVVADAVVGAGLGAAGKVVGNVVKGAVDDLSNAAKGKLGEAVTEVKYAAQGYRSAGNDVVKTGGKTATGREAVAKFDHKMTNVFTGKQLTVESKFNTSGYTANQQTVANQGYNVTIDRTTSQGLGNTSGTSLVGSSAGIDAQRNRRQ